MKKPRLDPFLVLLACGVVLRLLFLTSRSLWFDEGTTLILTRVPFARLADFVVRDEVIPPLYHALIRGWLAAFADPMLGIRLFSAACGIAALFAFRRLAANVLPERARLLAVFFAAFSSYWIHLAQDGRPYALLLLICVLQTTLAWDLTEKPSDRLWAAYAVLAGVGLWTHYYFAVLLAVQAGWLAFRWRREPRELARFAAAHAATAVLFLPWLPSFLRQFPLHRHIVANADALTPRQLFSLFGTMFFDVSFLGLALPPWTLPAAGAGFAALAALALRGPRDRARDFLLAHLGGFVALVALAELAVGRPVTQARFFTPLSPLALLLAAFVLSAPGAGRRAARLAAEVLVAAGTAGWFASALVVDPHLGALADSIRRSTDASLPLVYLETYYYLPMRAYYMPERRHFLIAEAAEGMDYAGYPPYDGVLDRAGLEALGPCVVMDEKRVLGGPPRWLGDGAQVAALLAHPARQ